MVSSNEPTLGWPRDSTQVDVQDEKELEFWSLRFHVSRDTVKEAVREVGPRFKDVQRHLSKW